MLLPEFIWRVSGFPRNWTLVELHYAASHFLDLFLLYSSYCNNIKQYRCKILDYGIKRFTVRVNGQNNMWEFEEKLTARLQLSTHVSKLTKERMKIRLLISIDEKHLLSFWKTAWFDIAWQDYDRRDWHLAWSYLLFGSWHYLILPISIVQSKKEIKCRALCEYIRGLESKSNNKRFVIPLLFAVSLVSSYRKYVCNVHFCHSSKYHLKLRLGTSLHRNIHQSYKWIFS